MASSSCWWCQPGVLIGTIHTSLQAFTPKLTIPLPNVIPLLATWVNISNAAVRSQKSSHTNQTKSLANTNQIYQTNQTVATRSPCECFSCSRIFLKSLPSHTNQIQAIGRSPKMTKDLKFPCTKSSFILHIGWNTKKVQFALFQREKFSLTSSLSEEARWSPDFSPQCTVGAKKVCWLNGDLIL